MNIISRIKNSIGRTFQQFLGVSQRLLRSLSKSKNPLAERILSDALQLSGIPSPTTKEEARSTFIVERLLGVGIQATLEEEGHLIARIPSPTPDDLQPILLVASLPSEHWHPTESLGRLDIDKAYGSGLADAVGPASLLAVAEALKTGTLRCSRDVLLLFTTSPYGKVPVALFNTLVDEVHTRPGVVLAVRGLSLGVLNTSYKGTYQIRVQLTLDDSDEMESNYSAVDVITQLAQSLSLVQWDDKRETTLVISRIEAGFGFGKHPTEGMADIELFSSDSAVLDMAMKAVMATAEKTAAQYKGKAKVEVVSSIPVGKAEVNTQLTKIVASTMKELHIKIKEKPALSAVSYFTTREIPALVLGMTRGHIGLEYDEIEVASLESGRLLLFSLLERLSKERVL
ncbi:hypothetical protein [Gracilinema caldarium]|uniref:Uncharacterized protein n=1 Tax=Gracilinema caldarium (strain ATCC 51460 / DSM 7334 / H1) TaxID=744872 RepID=F8F1H4_GRAC1|nr:hypothetical protein [Gracilinema caldarium]AEJ19027.1 hypothetical protein Spica_0873 [Gracilinema caldarium DSM 7334]